MLQGDKVSIAFETNLLGCVNVFRVVPAGEPDDRLNTSLICSSGLELSRDNFPRLRLSDTLFLRGASGPALLVESNRVQPAADIALQSVTLVGPDVQVIYKKSFTDIVNLIDTTGTPLNTSIRTFEQDGEIVTVLVSAQDFSPPLVLQQEVRLGVPFRPDLNTNSVLVGGQAPAISCVVSEQAITLRDRSKIFSSEVYLGADLTASYDTKIRGNVLGRGDATLLDRAVITGDVSLIGTVDNNGAINGTLLENVPVPSQALQTEFVDDGGPDALVNWDQTQTLSPGRYGDVLVRDRGVLKLSQGGEYSFSSLTFERDTRLKVNTNTGAYQIRVEGDFALGDRFKVRQFGGAADGKKIAFYTNDANVALGYDIVLKGSLTAPDASVTLMDRAKIQGCLRAQTITLSYDAKVFEN